MCGRQGGNHDDALDYLEFASLMESFGITDPRFIAPLYSQLSEADGFGGDGLEFGAAVIKGIKPNDQLEAMLGAQMAVMHCLSPTSIGSTNPCRVKFARSRGRRCALYASISGSSRRDGLPPSTKIRKSGEPADRPKKRHERIVAGRVRAYTADRPTNRAAGSLPGAFVLPKPYAYTPRRAAIVTPSLPPNDPTCRGRSAGIKSSNADALFARARSVGLCGDHTDGRGSPSRAESGDCMKRILIASALALAAGGQALAADLPPPPPAPATYIPVAPPYNWTGFYIGGNLGAGFSNGSFSDTLGSTFTNSTNTTFLGGGQVGVNYEFWGGLVIGAEAMFDWAPNQNNNITATNGVNTATAQINNRWLTTATGKLGYAWDRVLVYGKGGGAWVGQNSSSLAINGVPSSFSSSSSTNWGWTAGLGVEWAFWGNWSARAEYDYIGLNNQSFTVSAMAPGAFAGDVISANSRSINMFTAGVNYKFGPW